MSRLFISHIWSSAIFFSLVSSSHLLLRNPSVSPTTVDKLHHHAPFGTITSSQKHINASAHISIVTLSPLRRHRNKKQNVVTCLLSTLFQLEYRLGSLSLSFDSGFVTVVGIES
ncbi:hypothetical protein F2Q68_00033656 [Brassica cretica]|uniref:Uncharacterized protein n=1 Tax=Brassica cretica TaxID=69181 RepID=A0A8S9HB79_BRACR|nr:hypothetical protein F2Q68_00033656 [Brassica cretica]